MAQTHSLSCDTQRRAVRLSAAPKAAVCMTRAAYGWASDRGSDRLQLADVMALAGDGCGRRGFGL